MTLSALLVLNRLNTRDKNSSFHSEESDANEQLLTHNDTSIEQGSSRADNAVDQRFLHENAEVEPGFPSAPIIVEQCSHKDKSRTSKSSPTRAAWMDRSLHVRS